MPKFKAEYLFNKVYDFDGVKEIEAKDIKEAIEKFKKAGRRAHLIDETFETGIKKTVQWYLDNMDWCMRIKDRSYKSNRLG